MCCCSSPDPQSPITALPAYTVAWWYKAAETGHSTTVGTGQSVGNTAELRDVHTFRSETEPNQETRSVKNKHNFNALFIKNIGSSLNFRIYWQAANHWTDIYQRFHFLLLPVLFWGKYLSYCQCQLLVSMQIQIYCKLFFQRTVSVINTHSINVRWHQPLTAEQMRWIPEVHALYATDEQMGVNPDTLPEKAAAK